jgi:hypothetical protein
LPETIDESAFFAHTARVMNRLTAVGLASLVAYALLIGSKYAGFVPSASADRTVASTLVAEGADVNANVTPIDALPVQRPAAMPPPIRHAQPVRASQAALDFRAARDLKSYADALLARRDTLGSDERYWLAKALEECQFATTVNEDLAAFSAKQRTQFLSGLPANDPLNARRLAAYDAVDSSQRCLRFQGTKIAVRDIEELYRSSAMQGDPRAQSRMMVAELNKNLTMNRNDGMSSTIQSDDFSRIISLLESHDPEAILIVGQFLAQSAIANQIRIGPTGEYPEPSAFLGAFSLVACDMGPDCVTPGRELQLACAHGGYCNAQTFEELYQNFLASPWAWSQALRYRTIIYNAINTHDWSLIGLAPKGNPYGENYAPRQKSSYLRQKSPYIGQDSFLYTEE